MTMVQNEKTFVLPEPIPGYDPVKCKREAHARMRRETKGMTTDEVLEYRRKNSELFWEEQRHRRTKQTTDVFGH